MILIDNSSPLDYDELLEEAMKIFIQYNAVSARLLQRGLLVGYERAAKIIDQLELLGFISPYEGNGIPRKLLLLNHKQTNNKINLDEASVKILRVINKNYEILSPAKRYFYLTSPAIKIKAKTLLLKLSDFIDNLAYKI